MSPCPNVVCGFSTTTLTLWKCVDVLIDFNADLLLITCSKSLLSKYQLESYFLPFTISIRLASTSLKVSSYLELEEVSLVSIMPISMLIFDGDFLNLQFLVIWFGFLQTKQ